MSTNHQPRDLRVMHYTKEDAIRLTTGRPISPEEATFYQAGLDTYGQGFIAFLLATKAKDLPATELLDSYQNSHVSFAMSEIGARESLMYAIGIIDGYRHCKEEQRQGTSLSPPEMDSDRLLERLAQHFVIVHIENEWHVFDTRVTDAASHR